MNKFFRKRATRYGFRASILTLMLLAVLAAVNLLVSLLPTQYTILDSTYNGLYTLSGTTESYIKALDETVEIYFLCDEGAEDTRIRTFLDRYSGLNSRITVKTVDPMKNTTFVSTYTDKTLSNYSVIVDGGKRSLVLDYYDLYLWENEALGIMTAEEYAACLSDSYGSYILSSYETVQHFNGEAKITNAITYVTADRIPRIYALSGHGETALGADFRDTVGAGSYDLVKDLSLFSLGKVPEDCDILLINAPTKDLSADETRWIGAYLENGGHLLLTTAAGKTYTPYETKKTNADGTETTETVESDFPNLTSLLARYGLSAENGVIVEKDASMSYSGYPRVLLPSKNTAHPIVTGASGATMIYYDGHGIVLDKNVSGVTLTSLFSTSRSAYTVPGSAETLDRTEDSKDGPFTVGATAEKGDTRIVWLASALSLDDSIDSLVSGGNHTFAVSACDWIVGKEESVTIASVSLEEPKLIISGDTLTVFAVVFCAVIPFSILIGGLVYWLRRRRA
ncbi:MAG: GldG family protein [Clostridia bacterium]|nr:GldG family protein [Clostridia bacterium]